MSASDPWMKFYPADWRSDPKLRLVSMAARGLWMEMLCIMHEAPVRGELVVGGVALDAARLARMVGEPVSDASEWLAELQCAEVFSTRKNGVIYSRRMERDENRRRKMRENGKKGGNPSLCKSTKNTGLDNQGDKPKEARYQKLDKEIYSSDAEDRSQNDPPPSKINPPPGLDPSPPPEPPDVGANTEAFRLAWAAFPPTARSCGEAAGMMAFSRALRAANGEAGLVAKGLRAYAASVDDPKFVKRFDRACGDGLWREWAPKPALAIDERLWRAAVTAWQVNPSAWREPVYGPPPDRDGTRCPPQILRQLGLTPPPIRRAS